MTDFKTLFGRRLKAHLKEVGKYGRLIFNDHFSIILLVIFGLLSLYYRQLLLQLKLGIDQAQVGLFSAIMMIIFFLIISIGRPIWFTETADTSYLFARGKAWLPYWRKSLSYGIISWLIWVAITSSLCFPLAQVISDWSAKESIIFVLYMLISKVIHYIHYYLNAFQIVSRSSLRNKYYIVRLLPVISAGFMTISFWFSKPINLWVIVIGLLLMIGLTVIRYMRLRNHPIDFAYVIQEAKEERAGFYKLLALFADVPGQKSEVKRRKWLDPIVSWLDRICYNRYYFRFSRLLLRHPLYSGIWIKIWSFSLLLILLMPNQELWNYFFLAVAFFLIIIQLIPLYFEGETHVFQLIYPHQNSAEKLSAFRLALLVIFIIMLTGDGLVLLGTGYSWFRILRVLLFLLLFIGILLYLYLPFLIKRKEKVDHR